MYVSFFRNKYTQITLQINDKKLTQIFQKKNEVNKSHHWFTLHMILLSKYRVSEIFVLLEVEMKTESHRTFLSQGGGYIF